ncbi:hypothetical protein [Pectobacterium sp. CHL-2024]|uniref:hypothetical protein n=1 Tax=Pectobacterium sp. CHL-2024 TaxID=3377079 RepID=UPI00380403E2
MSDNRLAKNSLAISLASVIVALCALGLSVYQGYLQKKNYEISVQPYITLVPTIDGSKNEYGYYIYNAGLGNGYIDKIQYFINGREIKGDNIGSLRQVVHHFGFLDECFAYGNPRKGDSVALDKMNVLLSISSSASSINECKNTIDNFHKNLSESRPNFTVKIWYNSIYNIRYLYDSSKNIQEHL